MQYKWIMARYMEWPTCDEELPEPCPGIRVNDYSKCLSHLDSASREAYLNQLGPDSQIDLRGTVLPEEVIFQFCKALRGDSRDTVLPDLDFRYAKFTGRAPFNGTRFGKVRFGNAVFCDEANFDGVKFLGFASFVEAEFQGSAFFGGASFDDGVEFYRAKFSDGISFVAVSSGDDIKFDNSELQNLTQIGPVVAKGHVSFRSVLVESFLSLDVSAQVVDCHRANFGGGVDLRALGADISLDQTFFGGPSSVVSERREARLWQPMLSKHGDLFPVDLSARILSLQGTDVRDLVVADVDMSMCRFDGTHHLDELRLEGVCKFRIPPGGIIFGKRWLPVWFWSRRQSIVEECIWRASGGRATSVGWVKGLPEEGAHLSTKQIAGLYRQLRKAQEDSKDQPGAADFYYGEMEMRRNDSTLGVGEKVILFLYWMVSGYGLRATRSLGCLAALVLLASLAFWGFGFMGQSPSFLACLLYVSQSAVSLDMKAKLLPPLAWQGELLRLLMRVLGPILLGLAVLAVRNRVKR